jgi:hypothetical protein
MFPNGKVFTDPARFLEATGRKWLTRGIATELSGPGGPGIAVASSSGQSGPMITTTRMGSVEPIASNIPWPTTPAQSNWHEPGRTVTPSVSHRDAKIPATSDRQKFLFGK